MRKKYYILLFIALVLIGSYWDYRTVKADVFGNGLVGWWTLDTNTVVNNVIDSSGKGNTGILAATVSTTSQQVAGVLGQGISFNGTTQYISVAETSGLPVGTSKIFTFSVWVNTTKSGSEGVLVGEGRTTTATPQVGIYNSSSGKGKFFYRNDANVPNSSTGIVGSKTINDGHWHLIVGTPDGTTQTLYVDGKVDGPATSTPSGAITLNTDTLGALQRTTVGSFSHSTIDDPRIYSRALSASEVQTLYYQGISQHSNGDF